MGKIIAKGSDIMKKLVLLLVIVGAINWGLVGFFQYDLVAAIFGGQAAVAIRVIFAIVGLAGIYAITFLFRDNRDKVATGH